MFNWLEHIETLLMTISRASHRVCAIYCLFLQFLLFFNDLSKYLTYETKAKKEHTQTRCECRGVRLFFISKPIARQRKKSTEKYFTYTLRQMQMECVLEHTKCSSKKYEKKNKTTKRFEQNNTELVSMIKYRLYWNRFQFHRNVYRVKLFVFPHRIVRSIHKIRFVSCVSMLHLAY